MTMLHFRVSFCNSALAEGAESNIYILDAAPISNEMSQHDAMCHGEVL